MRLITLCVMAMLLETAAVGRGESELFPFVIPWDDAAPNLLDRSSRLEKPAGRHGFITARNGRLHAGKERIRLFGVNLCFGACFPTREDADKIAARLAKLGIGCVRFHHMDTEIAPNGLLRADSRSIDPEMLERLDYFIAALKKHGIYSNLNLHVGRVYPGTVRWPQMPLFCKGIDQFDATMIAAQKEFARELLTHLNPHTGNTYANEPAVAFVEINNENSLLREWRNGSLDEMPPLYWSQLRERWNRWLAARYPSPEAWRALVTAPAEPPGPELLKPTPKKGASPWAFEHHGETSATLRKGVTPAGGEAWEIQIAQPGKEDWHLQINHPGLALSASKPYTFDFEIAASRSRRVKIAVSQAEPPWRQLWSAEIVATPEWRKQSLVFNLGESANNARIGFLDLGETSGSLAFSSPSLRSGSQAAAPETPEAADLLRRNEFAGQNAGLQKAWIEFLWETERDYWREMTAFLRTELKVGSLLVGSQVDYSPAPIQAEMDVVDVHGYWEHPQFEKGRWNLARWSVRNVPMAGVPDGGALSMMAHARVYGKPFICTEYAHAAPNTYSSESLPLLAAYAALQDWDAVFAFAYSHRRDDWDAKRFLNFFDIDQHPAKLATLPASINLFTRGDLPTPAQSIVHTIAPETALDHARNSNLALRADLFGLPARAFFQRPVSVRFDAAPGETPVLPEEKGNVHYSDHRMLGWGNGRVVINTPRTKGVIGAGSGQRVTLGDIAMISGPTRQNWSALLLTEQNGTRAIQHYLLSATGDVENRGMEWQNAEKSSVGTRWGKPPSLVEGIPATIEFTGRSKIRAWALDEKGNRAREIPVSGGKVVIGPEYRTLWYEIECTLP